MSLRTNIAMVTALLLLAACGFQPVYGKRSSAAAESPLLAGLTIKVGSSDNQRMAQQFQQDLEDLVTPRGRTPNPVYRLDVSLNASSSGLGVARDGTASRYNLIINSTYKITRIADDKLMTNGTLRNVTSYNNPNNQYFSTYVSEQDARKRGVTELAEMYRQRLASYTEKTLVPHTEKPVPMPNTIAPYNPLNYENRTQTY